MRFFGNNWDHGYHLHPDERMIIMVAEKIKFFTQLNPKFFNYGSFPIYILEGTAQFSDSLFSTNYRNYDNLLYWGRMIVSCLDIFTIMIVFKLSKIIFKNSAKPTRNENIALYASLFYSLSFFPIQNSNFFVVDNFINFLLSLLILFIIKYFYTPSKKHIIYIAIIYAALIASKFTPIIFLPLILLIVFFEIKKNKLTFKIKSLNKFKNLFLFIDVFLIFNFIFMPYTYLNFDKFFTDIKLQTKMNSNAYIFPYTLQYVGTIPYLYYLKNIALWGVGPIIFILFAIGLYLVFKKQIQNHDKNRNFILIFYLIINLYYFLFIGRSAVKFMRYMLPIYPFISIISAYGFSQLIVAKKIPDKIKKVIKYSTIPLIFIWTLSFLTIYTKPHTRVAASEWIINNIPKHSKIAVEHWDDRLPITQSNRYRFVEMTLYELPDDRRKWIDLNQKLDQADYLILSSNRLYIPLQKLSDCSKYRKCYPKTAQYYEDLFNEKLNFKKVAEFDSYPHLPFSNTAIIADDSADESFTVYDHPKVIIFEKMK